MKSYASFRRPVRLTLASSALALSLSLGVAQVHAQESVPANALEGTNSWFIELTGAPEADGNSRAAVRAEKEAFRKAAAAAGVEWKERRSYDLLFNGFSVEASPADRLKLARLPGFKAMYPVEAVGAPDPIRDGGVAADLSKAIAMTGANIAQSNGWTGAGIKVGIIDSGIDIDHPDFGGTGVPGTTPFPSARVAYGYDFVGDAYAFPNDPVPDPIPDDCGGHGSHVAGIVGANGAIKGVAPGVTFGAYRVFGCTGSTATDNILAALERAYIDGMDIINQSLGSGRQWPQYPTAAASSRLVQRGVIMVASIGNNGPNGSSPDGIYAAGAPGVGKDVIGVASYDNAQNSFTVNGTPYGYNPASGSPMAALSGGLPLGRTWTGAAPSPATSTTAAPVSDGCAALPAGSLAGQAVLIRRGTCGFYQKALNAQNAGAAAVILYNNQVGALNATVAGTPAITIPVVGITAAQGVALHNLVANGPTTLTWSSAIVSYPYGTGGLISGFSSFGLAADLSLKPNLGGPGGSIFSTYPLEAGGYATLSGTSMSSPHVAGAVALVLQARPKTSPGLMKVLLQNGADPKLWNGNPALGFLDNVHRQGAGLIDIPQAIAATSTVTPSELALGESAAGTQRIKLQINNNAKKSVTYDVSHVPALATAAGLAGVSGTFVGEIGYFSSAATVEFERSSFTVQGPSVENFDIRITAPNSLADRGIYGGYIVFTPRDGGPVLRVPYAGYKGDYQAIRVLSPTANSLPWLAKNETCANSVGVCNSNYRNYPNGATFSLAGNDIPYFPIHLDHHSQAVLLEALDSSGNVVGRISLDEWVTRNSSATGFFVFAWDGSVYRKNPARTNQWMDVPNGDYYVRVSVTKALAEKNNADHVETWTSPRITVARP